MRMRASALMATGLMTASLTACAPVMPDAAAPPARDNSPAAIHNRLLVL
ncbi:MAG: hypothetical protein RLZZ58_1985, partial [Pseudomonadota bacterium]